MADYFQAFPLVDYDIKKNKQYESVTNVMLRFKISEVLTSSEAVYYDYFINEGDRPDTVAFKLYDNPTYDWLLLLINQIHDPLFEWPLDYEAFRSYIKGKYGSVSTAQSTVHEYQWIYQASSRRYNGDVIPEKAYVVDSDTYATLSSDQRRIIYKYDYEENLNNERRRIRIIDKKHITNIVGQINYVFE